jgi:polygalacturonase
VIQFPSNYKFLTGALNITSRQIWWIDENTQILAYQGNDTYHYPLVPALPSYPISTKKNSNPRYQGFISSYQATMIAIIGPGTIDGQGHWWWKRYNNDELTLTRPRLVELSYSSMINVSSVSLKNSPFWTLHFYSSENITVNDINVNNPVYAPNTDGMDIDSSTNVIVDGISISTADDHISIKSGENSEGFYYNKSSSNIRIQNSFFGLGAGLAIGSETSGGVNNVIWSNNTLRLSGNGVRFKTCPNYGYPIQSVVYENMDLDIAGIAVFVSEDYSCSSPDPSIPSGGYHGIVLNNWSGNALEAGDIQCFAGGCTKWLFSNITLNTGVGFRCANITGVAFNVSPPACV